MAFSLNFYRYVAHRHRCTSRVVAYTWYYIIGQPFWSARTTAATQQVDAVGTSDPQSVRT